MGGIFILTTKKYLNNDFVNKYDNGRLIFDGKDTYVQWIYQGFEYNVL